jgi:DNA-directed RNA polymerase subunit K/omega
VVTDNPEKVHRTYNMPRAEQNKYELVIVAARHARRLNDLARLTGEPLPGRVTAIALGRVLDDEVPFTYEEPAPPPAES